MQKKVLLLDGHPAEESLCHGLVQAYAQGATAAGHALQVQRLSEMVFDPDLGVSKFRDAPPLEPDLERFWDDLVWSEHFVIVHPLWWGGMPAKLKGLIDRAFLHGKAFRYVEGKPLPEALLKGRTSRVLMTSDTPSLFLHLAYVFGLKKQTERQILNFCGLKSKGYAEFSPVRGSKPEQRDKWLARATALGRRAA